MHTFKVGENDSAGHTGVKLRPFSTSDSHVTRVQFECIEKKEQNIFQTIKGGYIQGGMPKEVH